MSDTPPPDYAGCTARPRGRRCDLDVVQDMLGETIATLDACALRLARNAQARGCALHLLSGTPRVWWREIGGGLIVLPVSRDAQQRLQAMGATWQSAAGDDRAARTVDMAEVRRHLETDPPPALQPALVVALARGAILRGIAVYLAEPPPLVLWAEADGLIALPCARADQDALEDLGAQWQDAAGAERARAEPIENILRRLRGVA